MSIPRILFFGLLVVLAITEIYSGPAGGKGSKTSEGKKTADENVHDMNERRVSEDIHGDSAIGLQTVNRHVEAVPGDNGYISSNIAGPSGSNPSHQYRENPPIPSTNPLSDAFSSIHLGNKPETLTQLSGKRGNTRSDGASKKKASESTSLTDDMRENLKRLETYRKEKSKLTPDPLGEGAPPIPNEVISQIKIIAPDVISWKESSEGSFIDIKVPENYRAFPEAYKRWFMKTLPDHGYYKDKVGSEEVGKLKSVEQTKTIIKLLDEETYGFVVPKKVFYTNENLMVSDGPVPEKAKESRNKLNEWLRDELPKYYSIELLYNQNLVIEHRGSLKFTGFR